MKTRYFILIIFAIGIFSSQSCKKNSFLDGEGVLEFNRDTVFFDTVFTRIAGLPYPRSYNKRLVVKNPYKESIKVDISLAGDGHSPFRLNIDGIAGNSIKNYEIEPLDSIYIFVEATLEPNNLNLPAIVKDSINFTTGGHRQKVILAAYGWDAHYYRNVSINQNTVWDDKIKPYVVVDSVLLASGNTLNVNDGVTVYSSPNSYIFIGGTLKVNGTKSSRVVFRGDRLDRGFDDVENQWLGIRFLRNSTNNVIKYADIKNAIVGIQVDSLPLNNPIPNLVLENTHIMNMGNIGLLGLTAKIKMTNSAISNCGSYTFLGYFGGDYNFRHCTFANGNNSGRRDPHFVLNNVQRDQNNEVVIKKYPLAYTLLNNVIYGPLEDEIGFDTPNNPPSIAIIQRNYITTKIKDLNVNGNKLNINPKFIDLKKNNVRPDTTSILKDSAILLNPAILFDLDGKNRDAKPDIGAFESKY